MKDEFRFLQSGIDVPPVYTRKEPSNCRQAGREARLSERKQRPKEVATLSHFLFIRD